MISNAQKFMDSDLLALMQSAHFEFVPLGKVQTGHVPFGQPQQRVFLAKDSIDIRNWLATNGYNVFALPHRPKPAYEIDLFAKSFTRFGQQYSPINICLVSADSLEILKYIDGYLESHPAVSPQQGWGGLEFDNIFQISYHVSTGYNQRINAMLNETERAQESIHEIQKIAVGSLTAQVTKQQTEIDALMSKIVELTAENNRLKSSVKPARVRKPKATAN